MSSTRRVPHRALPSRAYLPGGAVARPAGEAPSVCQPLRDAGDAWRDHEGYLWGVDLYEHGYPWEAHEAWEAAWAATAPASPERALVGGLVQLAAAVVQARLGRWGGVTSLAAKARRRLAEAGRAAPVLCGIAVAPLADAIAAWAARAAATGEVGEPPRLGLAA
ncbi:MAG: DUF309 domain-containing protein [Kofleriaceae bacterium]|nr:DUF309 domain-containing protein [Kofleriaceae bacterium]